MSTREMCIITVWIRKVHSLFHTHCMLTGLNYTLISSTACLLILGKKQKVIRFVLGVWKDTVLAGSRYRVSVGYQPFKVFVVFTFHFWKEKLREISQEFWENLDGRLLKDHRPLFLHQLLKTLMYCAYLPASEILASMFNKWHLSPEKIPEVLKI